MVVNSADNVANAVLPAVEVYNEVTFAYETAKYLQTNDFNGAVRDTLGTVMGAAFGAQVLVSTGNPVWWTA